MPTSSAKREVTIPTGVSKAGFQFTKLRILQLSEDTATNIPGVYAAGNASRGVQLVIAAAAEGMQAAFAINSALLDADAASNALRDHEPGQPTPSGRITPGNEAVN